MPPKFFVDSPLEHDKTLYKPGETITLTSDEAAALPKGTVKQLLDPADKAAAQAAAKGAESK